MLDNIREWISDNLRYILLILAVILLVIIAFFAVRLVTHIGTSGSGSTTTKKTEQQTDAQTEEQATASASEELLDKDNAEVLELVTAYWTAIGEQDFDTLETICGKTFDESARATVAAMDMAVESYDNIIAYCKSGLTDGAYVVYVYMDLKLTGISTEAPTLRQMYLQPDDDGNLLVVQSDDYTSEIKAYTQERQADADVQALISDVSATLTARCASDDDLKQYIESSSTSSSSSSDEDEEDSSSLGIMQVSANSNVNVRSEASTDGSIYASLSSGTQVEVLENLDSGWSRITYTDSSGSTIEGYMKTEYLAAVD